MLWSRLLGICVLTQIPKFWKGYNVPRPKAEGDCTPFRTRGFVSEHKSRAGGIKALATMADSRDSVNSILTHVYPLKWQRVIFPCAHRVQQSAPHTRWKWSLFSLHDSTFWAGKLNLAFSSVIIPSLSSELAYQSIYSEGQELLPVGKKTCFHKRPDLFLREFCNP